MLARWSVPVRLRSIPHLVPYKLGSGALRVVNRPTTEGADARCDEATFSEGRCCILESCLPRNQVAVSRTGSLLETAPARYCSSFFRSNAKSQEPLLLSTGKSLIASDGGTSATGSQSLSVLQTVAPAALESDPPRQLDVGNAVIAVKDPSRSPQALVEYLDSYIVGQTNAKRAVAVALRQRWRRRQVPDPDMRADITPKNILLIGPTGVGKTEIARRLAQRLDAPFLKVEATKYTEVGFHGRDVDQIIKDLMEVAVKQKKTNLETRLKSIAEERAESKVLEALGGKMPAEEYAMWLRHLRRGSLDSRRVQIDMPMMASEATQGDFRMMERRYVTIKEALARLTQAELDAMITKDMIIQQAVEAVEQEGIVFIDEIDKICSKSGNGGYHGPDASDEGVQRDLLPLLEGSTVSTRFGEIKTDYILFIASGAFHSVRPSDLLAELQGRLPVRVTLNPLSEEDFRQILTRTKHNLIEQYKALLATEGVVLEFSDDAIAEVARVAWEVNSQIENIGARRLHTIIEKSVTVAFVIGCMGNDRAAANIFGKFCRDVGAPLPIFAINNQRRSAPRGDMVRYVPFRVLEDINLNASLQSPGTMVVVDRQHVMDTVNMMRGNLDHTRFIL
ncbi:ATP-dependent heat shock protein [Cyclospora cayetanensis]|uniref:ATP-dependent heat shock protein n=1 Tax=Cyclospora cayetanensis TaxID=88456 RepID=A0A1D3CT24_9EIME|nr:ATP-dependent heat shock protein [Cyclospora cayetanensis]